MLPLFQAKPADRRLLQEGRLAGPMPWVIAIMMFLTVLAAAAGLALGTAARGLSADLAGRLTVQFSEANPVLRETGKQAILSELGRLAVIERVEPVSEDRLVALLDPWLGKDGYDADLPMPALIDVELRRATPSDVEQVRKAIQSVAPAARVDEHAQWLAPLASLLQSLKWLSAALVALMTAATAATVVLAARAALNTHKSVIEVMHLLGSTDGQVAGLFQRRIALDALFGGFAGLVAALVVMLLIGNRLNAIGSDLLGSGGLGWGDWAIVLALPLFGTVLAILAARFTVLFALRRIL
jgi:cell division transport system permease protein